MRGKGTAADPWILNTPAGGSEFTLHHDEDKDVLHCQVGKTWLHYRPSSIDDLHAMLEAHGDWMELGNKDEKVEPKAGTVEAWARSKKNPVGGLYGLRKGYRGRFANHIAPALVAQGRAKLDKRGRSMWIRAT